MSFLHNLIASLPDRVEDTPDFEPQIIVAADDEPKEEKKDKPEAKKDEKPKDEDKAAGVGDKPEIGGLPSLPPPMPMLPGLPGAGPAVGSKVRDKLSGQTGVVQAPPPGDFGRVVFVKSDADGQTHPVLSEFLEILPGAGPMLPSLEAPLPAADHGPESPIPSATPSSLEAPSAVEPKASSTKPTYRAWLKAKKKVEIKAATPETKKEKKSVLKMWETPRDYSGPDYPDYYYGLAVHRDSEVLERANYDALLEKLGGVHSTPEWEQTHPEEVKEGNSEVMEAEASHWMVGWAKTILIHKDSKIVPELEKILTEFEEYPVIDEDKYNQYEMEQAESDWSSYGQDMVMDAVNAVEGLQEKTFDELDPSLQSEVKEAFQSAWEDSGGDIRKEDLQKHVTEAAQSWVKEGPTREMKTKEESGQQELPGVERMKARLAAKVRRIKAAKVIQAGLHQLPSGRWADTNGNSYATKEEAAGAEAHSYMHPKDDPESAEYKKSHKSTKKALAEGRDPIEGSQDFIVTADKDERKLKYSDLLTHVKAVDEPTHASVLEILGYVPENWDILVARLMQDGIILRSKMAKYDVMEFVAKGFSQEEIRLILGRNGVPMYALDAAFKKIKADKPIEVQHTAPLGTPEEEAKLDKAVRGIKADKPTKPMPTEPAGQGMTWAWDPTAQNWYEAPITA